MKQINWNKEELKQIKRIILQKTNFVISNDGSLERVTRMLGATDYYHFLNYDPYMSEIEDLLYIENKDEIASILNKAKEIKVDPTNPEHYGFIMNISKVNPQNNVNIFIIFKEIIAQYEKVTSKVANMFVENYVDVTDLIEKSREFIYNSELTNEEILVKSELNKIFALDNGITKSELFRPLITKLDSNIKSRLNIKIDQNVRKIARAYQKNVNKTANEYHNERAHKLKKAIQK